MFYCFVQVKCKIKPDVGILIKLGIDRQIWL